MTVWCRRRNYGVRLRWHGKSLGARLSSSVSGMQPSISVNSRSPVISRVSIPDGVLDMANQHSIEQTRTITWRRNAAVKTLPRSLASTWGTTAAERTLSYPCDRNLSPFDAAYFRAVLVRAPASIILRWLCQLRVAPYSYDWIDNGGHPSPRELIPGLDLLQVGQRVMTIFQLVDFKPNRH